MKKLVLLFHFIFALFLVGTQLIFAQSFPVQVIPQALPPAPIYFSDYADESTVTSPLRVQLILNDLQVASKEVRLKASFEGNGISFESNAIVSGAPLLFLESGIPLNLTNIELAPYFKFENIVGISPNVYGQPIPEGTYRFCFEVFDAFSGNRISDRTCAGTVIFQNDPPILISPLNKSIVEERNPQNIIFQWTPRHINVSNVEYELSIVEIWDNQIDHQAAFLSSPPIFQTTTSATTYLYGPADPQLLSDKNYAWRVQAKAKQGTEEIGLFKNQGYSTIFVFGNTGVCDLPLGINHEVKGATNANISWDDITSESPEFQIRYRATGGDTEWFYSKTTANLITIWDLEAGTEYEYQLAKTCALSESEYSPIKTFRTNLFDSDDSAYECGIAPNIDVTNEIPLANLSTDEKFTAGDFPVTVTEVNGSNGYFNGKGYVTIPYLKSIKVAVEFTNIFINELRELKQGNVITLYDPSLKGIVDPWDALDDIEDIINGGDFTIYQPVDFDIESVQINGDQITINGTDADGNATSVTYNYDSEDRYQITGANGVFSIDENGNLNPLGQEGEGGAVTDTNTTGVESGRAGTADDPAVTQIADSDVEIKFIQDPKAKYGWDEATSTYEKETYPKVTSQSGTTFYPIHKAVKNGDTDTFFVEVDIKKEGLTLEDLIFKTVNGLEIKTELNGSNRLKVTIQGTNGYRSEEAVITYKESEERQVVVSSFFIHHLRPLNAVNVTLVPVGGYSIPSTISPQVTSLFTSAGANLNLTEGSPFNGDTSGLQYTESGLLSKHPQSFKEFYTDFKNNYSGYSSDTYYVFLFDQNVQPGKNLAGFMPRGTQFGYVFSANISTIGLESKQTISDVVAHEIGHGVMGIGHPADNDLGTDWLMDMGKGNQLAKRDWEIIGDAGINLYLFDDDGDGSSAIVSNIEALKDFRNDDGTYTFLTSSGKPITLPPNTTNIAFSTGDKLNTEDCTDDSKFNIIPFGVLLNFQIADVKYSGRWDCRGGLFSGYKSDEASSKFYYDSYTNESIGSAITGIPTVDPGGNIIYKVGKIPFDPISVGANYNGSGSYQEYDFLVERINKISFFKELHASFDPEFSTEVRQFIYDQIDKQTFNGQRSYANDAYIFIHATQLEHYSILKGCFKTGVPGQLLNLITKTVYRGSNYGLGKEVIRFRSDYEEGSSKDNLKELVNRWKDYDINYYPELSRIIKDFQIPENASASDIDNLFDNLKINNSPKTDNWDCLWETITLDDRKRIIRTFANDGYIFKGYGDFNNDSEHIILKIFTTVQNLEDKKALLEFINNYKYLNYIFDSLDYDKPESQLFAAQITQFVLETQPDYVEAYSTWINETYSFVKNLDVFPGPPYTPMAIEVETELFSLFGTELLGQAPSGWFEQETTNGWFSSMKTKLKNDGGIPVVDLRHIVSHNSKYGIVHFTNTFNIYDPVLLYINDNRFERYNVGLDKGTYVCVPSIFVLWLNSMYTKELQGKALRIGLNVLAIAAAPFTSGGSLTILTIEVGLATADIIITLNEDKFREKFGQEGEALWNSLYGLWNVSRLVQGLAGNKFLNFNTKRVNGKDLISSINIDMTKARQFADELSKSGNQTEKLRFISMMDQAIDAIRAGNFNSKVANMVEVYNDLLTFRVKIMLSLDEAADGADFVVKESFLLKANCTNCPAIAKVDFISSRPTLTKDIRWLPDNITNVKKLGELKHINYLEGGANKAATLELIEDVNRTGQIYVRLSSIGTKIYRGISESTFINSVPELVTNPALGKKAFDLWGNKKWGELEALFKTNNINKYNDIIYPPMNGFVEVQNLPLIANSVFDRYGGWFDKGVFRDKGKFVSPQNVPFEKRALPAAAQEYPKQTYRVIKEIPNVKQGEAIPWFEQPGLGLQYQLPKSIDELVKAGYIVRVNDNLIKNGKFIDNTLESAYQSYLLRKTREGKPSRPRLEWKEVRDYWLNDSPLARGNRFNETARIEGWYPYDEVTLANGKRLDSYRPPKDGNPGEIVSRKATDLSDISQETFVKYLNEMKNKYKPGTQIKAPKYGDALKDMVLEGKMYLEIPDTNLNLVDLDKYKSIAQSKGIELRFKKE